MTGALLYYIDNTVTSKPTSIRRIAGFAVLMALALYISNTSIQRYLIGAEAGPPPILANVFAYPWLAVHAASAIFAMVIGPFQFVSAIRCRWPRLHRAAGLTYVAACAVAVPTGLLLAFGASTGPITAAGFCLLAILTGLFTLQGLRAAFARRFDVHREWMLRSYAMIAAAITLRLMIPASFLLGLDFTMSYRVIAWACWMVNLALVELYIRRTRTSLPRIGVLAPA